VIRWTTVRTRASWLAAVMLVAATASARAECKPTAVLQGDAPLVQFVGARLTANGIATTRATGCPAVDVMIERHGPQVHLRVTDAFQRQGERDVQDVATAAAIVESWTTQEIEAGVLFDEPAAVAASAAIAISPARRVARSGIAASVASAVANDGTTWIGGSISACVRTGPFCSGVMVRADLDSHATGPTVPAGASSIVLSPMATIDLPRRLGGFVVTPGLGLGYGFMHVVTGHHDPMGNSLESSDHELRLGAHVALARPWTDRLAVFADLWGDGAPVRSDASLGPNFSVRLSLGIRLEAM
jgi:hypothetical protein